MITTVNRQSKINYKCLCLTQKKSAVIRESIIRKYQEIQTILDEDLRMTLSYLEMEERAAVSALDGLMEKNCSLIQEIEQDLARLTVAMDQADTQTDTMVTGAFPLMGNISKNTLT